MGLAEKGKKPAKKGTESFRKFSSSPSLRKQQLEEIESIKQILNKGNLPTLPPLPEDFEEDGDALDEDSVFTEGDEEDDNKIDQVDLLIAEEESEGLCFSTLDSIKSTMKIFEPIRLASTNPAQGAEQVAASPSKKDIKSVLLAVEIELKNILEEQEALQKKITSNPGGQLKHFSPSKQEKTTDVDEIFKLQQIRQHPSKESEYINLLAKTESERSRLESEIRILNLKIEKLSRENQKVKQTKSILF